MTTRVIALVDMDCFYCQVEEKLNPDLQGKPVAVVQYNLWREGGIIAANYIAKEKGVTKGMWKHEAKDLCPEIEFARVAELRGRADLTKYREAGNQVVEVLSTFTNLLERASIDEAYLDLTEAVRQELMKGISNIPLEKLKTTHIVGYDIADFISNISRDQDTDGFCEDDLKLAIGGIIVERIRASIYEKTGYRCSAGIAHNKILAKLVCGLHKPNKQTILPGSSVPQLFSELPLKKIKRLGGKFGKKISEELNITKVGELLQFSEKELTKKFDLKIGHWLYNIGKGIDNEPVLPKILSKSLSCCKRFPGKNALFKEKDVEYWVKELALEVAERLAKDRESNNRKAKMATVSFVQDVNKNDVNTSKTFTLRSYEANIIAQDALELVKKSCRKSDRSYYLKYLGISVGSFEDIKNIKDIKIFFEKNKLHSVKSLDSTVELEKKVGRSKAANEDGQSLKRNAEDVDPDIFDNPCLSIGNVSHEQSNTIKDLIHSTDTINKIKSNEELGNCCQGTYEAGGSIDSKSEVISDDNKDSFFTRYFKNTNTDSIFNSKDDLIPNKSSKNFVEMHEGLENNLVPGESSKNFDINENSHKNIAACGSETNHEIYEISDTDSIITGSSKNYDTYKNMKNNEKIIYKTCEECGKHIGIDDFDSHLDYHFALKLQEQEVLPKKENSRIDIKNFDQSSKKRKACDFGNASLDLFLKTVETRSEEPTDICEMCNKKIRVSELLSHLDYHAAKNLHKMLNTQNTSYDGNFSRKNTVKSNGIMRYLKRNSS